MTYKKINLSLILLSLIVCIACNPPPPTNQNLPESETNAEAEDDAQELQQQSDDFDKSIEELNVAMDLAREINEKIQLVEQQFERGEITQQRRNSLITALNEKYKKQVSLDSEQTLAYLFPEWAIELGLSEPGGMINDADNSYQTNESDPKDGYNSILFVYKGSYKTALKEAARIAREANIPMSENYKKAQELSEKLGKKIEGMKGMTFMNYQFGNKNDGQKYHISINVDENGKLTMTVVDIILKSARRNAGNPNLN